MCVQELKILRIAAIRAFGDNRRTKMDFGMCQHVLHVQTGSAEAYNCQPVAIQNSEAVDEPDCIFDRLHHSWSFLRRFRTPVVAVGNLHDQQSPTRERLRSKARGERTVNPKAIRVKSMRLNDQGIFLACFVIRREVQSGMHFEMSGAEKGDFLDFPQLEFAELGVEVEKYRLSVRLPVECSD